MTAMDEPQFEIQSERPITSPCTRARDAQVGLRERAFDGGSHGLQNNTEDGGWSGPKGIRSGREEILALLAHYQVESVADVCAFQVLGGKISGAGLPAQSLPSTCLSS